MQRLVVRAGQALSSRWVTLFWASFVALGLLTLEGVDAFVDLGVYRTGGAAVLADLPLYRQYYEPVHLPFTYPPFAALVFTPFALVPFELLVPLWTGLSLLALARSVVLVAGWTRRTWAERGGVGWAAAAHPVAALLAVAVVVLDPVTETLRLGQVNFVVMWLVLEDLLGRTGRRRGWLVGIAAGIKLTPGVFLLLLLLSGQRRAATRAGAGLALTVLLGLLVIPADSFEYWTRRVRQAGRMGSAVYAGNQSIRATLTRWLPDTPFEVYSGLVGFTVLAGLVVVAAALWRRGLRLSAVSTTAVAGLLASPVSWTHHWVWTLVVLTAVAEHRGRDLRSVAVWVSAGLLGAACLLRLPWWGDDHLVPGLTGLPLRDAYVLLGLVWGAVMAWAAVAVPAARPGVRSGAATPGTEVVDEAVGEPGVPVGGQVQ